MRLDQFRRTLDRRSFGRAGGLAALLAGLSAATGSAGAAEDGAGRQAGKGSNGESERSAGAGAGHRAGFQISSDDRKTQMLLLGNVHNYAAFYRAKHEPFTIEIVAFGPGLSMLRADISMMKGELENLQKDLGGSLTVSACHNTRAGIAGSENRKPEDIPLLPGVTETPSGIVRLAELQWQGYAYLRP